MKTPSKPSEKNGEIKLSQSRKSCKLIIGSSRPSNVHLSPIGCHCIMNLATSRLLPWYTTLLSTTESELHQLITGHRSPVSVSADYQGTWADPAELVEFFTDFFSDRVTRPPTPGLATSGVSCSVIMNVVGCVPAVNEHLYRRSKLGLPPSTPN